MSNTERWVIICIVAGILLSLNTCFAWNYVTQKMIIESGNKAVLAPRDFPVVYKVEEPVKK